MQMNRVELDKMIKKESETLLSEQGYISSVDMLMRLNYLNKADYENW